MNHYYSLLITTNHYYSLLIAINHYWICLHDGATRQVGPSEHGELLLSLLLQSLRRAKKKAWFLNGILKDAAKHRD